MGKFLCLFLVFLGVFQEGFSLFREEHIITTSDKEPPYLTHILFHVYYIGVRDNGTLDCKMPGAVEYQWNTISKEEVTDGGYVYSWNSRLKIPNRERPWEMEIHHKNYLTDSLLVQCQGKSGYGHGLIAEILWVITRLHSPIGYPTDPIICTGSSCKKYERQFRINCDGGQEHPYQGSISHSFSGARCSDWNMVLKFKYDLVRSKFHFPNKYSRYVRNLEHNQCRTPYNGHKKAQCYVGSKGAYQTEACDVPKCSDCKYGQGKGLLNKKKVPDYNGTAVHTLKRYKSGKDTKYRTCFRVGDHMPDRNLCRNKLKIHGEEYNSNAPSCLVYRGDGDTELEVKDGEVKKKLQLAKCRIRQCTIRIVWFLFLDGNGQLIIDVMSSEKPRKFIGITGEKLRINYIVFGMNLVSGLRVGSEDERKNKIASKWKMSAKRAPKMSYLDLRKVTKASSGTYYFHYVFEEADKDVELGEYRQMFKIEILDPLKISLSPAHFRLCEWEKADIHLKTSGDFPIAGESIEWHYKLSGNRFSQRVPLDSKIVKISHDAMKVTVGLPANIGVTVKWKHKTLKANAKVTNIKKPVLQNVSPFLTLALPGETIGLTLATDSAENRFSWIHDAQEIAEVPEDPNMAFSQIRTTKGIIHTLKIENIQSHHYGVYVVKATNLENCQRSLEFILKKPPTRENIQKYIAPTFAPLTNKVMLQFKGVMAFMNKECANVTQRPNDFPTIAPPRTDDFVQPTDSDSKHNLSSESEADKKLSDNDDDDELLLLSESEDDEPRRKKRSIMAASKYTKLPEPLCIYLQVPNSYFEINLEPLTRVKGISLLNPSHEELTTEAVLSNITYRFMYSIGGCKWKIYGIKSYKDISNISSQANNTDFRTDDGPAKGLEMIDKTETFAVDGNITWIGNNSLIFARRIRLVPAFIDSSNKTCIKIRIYGCPATLFDVAKKSKILSAKSSDSYIVVIAAVSGVGCVLLVVGIYYVTKRWKKKRKAAKKRKVKKSLGSGSEESETDGDSEDSGTSEEHYYCEISNLESESTPSNKEVDHYYSTVRAS